jgi:hypothetical protein
MEPQSLECMPSVDRLNRSREWTVGTICVGDRYADGASESGLVWRWMGIGGDGVGGDGF